MSPRQQPLPRASGARTSNFAQTTSDLVADFRDRRPLRAGSLLISVFGDAIAPRGGTVWLGSLIRVLENFGVNQRLVRTTVFRLAKDGWLSSEQVGRRSYYSLTRLGYDRIEEASQRIYTEPQRDWHGSWTLVLLSGIPAALRDTVRKELAWLGFAPFSASLMAHPAADTDSVNERLQNVPGNERLLVMQAQVEDDRGDYLRSLVSDSWALADLGVRYADFLERFAPVLLSARRARKFPPEQAFHARTLLIHEYRKIILRDPLLPAALLPGRWDGLAAYELCRDLYASINTAAEQFLDEHMETASGSLPAPDKSFYARFGGLARNPAGTPPKR